MPNFSFLSLSRIDEKIEVGGVGLTVSECYVSTQAALSYSEGWVSTIVLFCKFL